MITSKSKGTNLIFVFTFLLCVFLTGQINAQTATSSINGNVTDQQGKVVAGATITVSNAEKSFSRTTTSSEDGTYLFSNLQPGLYRVEIVANGFKKYQTETKALVDTPIKVDAVLEIGSVNEVVSVSTSSGDLSLNTQDGTVGNTFVSQQLTQLPTEARNVLSLLTLQPGVTRQGYVAGVRNDQSNVTLDGADNNEAQTNDIATPVLRLQAEAVEEFRVTTTTANASQGRSSGAQISLITKSGTNEFHASAFLTGRRTGWTSNNFFNNRAGVGREKFNRDVFGFSVGGPVIKDRLFFFYGFERLKDEQEATRVRVVPLANLGQGIVRFRNSSGAVVSINAADAAQIYPAAISVASPQGFSTAAMSALAAAAAKYQANDFTVGDSTASTLLNTAGYRFNAPINAEQNNHVLKLDYNLTQNQQIFARGTYIYDKSLQAPMYPDTPAPGLWSHPTGIAAGHTWTINNNMVNTFRFGLTRASFTQLGDSGENEIFFRFIYAPRLFTRDVSRVTPVYNYTDDFSWVVGSHTLQFGTNLRFISNQKTDFAVAYDRAFTNPSFYPQAAITGPLNTYLQNTRGYQVAGSDSSNAENAITAVLGRLTQYSSNFTFDSDGTLLTSGSPTVRDFRTEEYDFYVQDSWKLNSNLTLNLGLRYGLSRPVYEKNGFEVAPTVPLGQLFEKRAIGAAAGTPFNDPVILDLSGSANNKPPLYKWDKNNFQPSISVAWNPSFEGKLTGFLFGKNGESVFRGGFRITNDYYGQALAVRFDLNNTLGFSSSSQINANTYNLTNNLAPVFTAFGMQVRPLPNIAVPVGNLTFPRQSPNRAFPTAIQGGLDGDLVAPIHYSWSFTYERSLPKGFKVQASYLGRKARQLLAARDFAAIANFVDTVSGMDWYTAAGQLEAQRSAAVPVANISPIAYFSNIFPTSLAADLGCPAGYNQTQAVYSLMVPTAIGGCPGYNYGNDWTSPQLDISLLSSKFPGQHIFYQPQYGTYGAWSSIGKSDYNAVTITVQQRLSNKLTFDFNYTLSQSMDDGSGLLRDAVTSGAGFLLNPFRQEDMWAVSDFDTKHVINANAIWQLPFGKGQWIANTDNKWANFFIGGWQMSGIFRWNSGLPIGTPYDDSRWATNWNVQSYTTRLNNNFETCPDRGGVLAPKLFGCDPTGAYRSFRNALPGETGERNALRLPGYWTLDMGLAKSFNMPWSENHKFQARWEVFNVANYQAMGAVDGSRSGYGLGLDPARRQLSPPSNWSNFTGIQGDRRIMQFVLRYAF